MNIKQSLCLRC